MTTIKESEYQDFRDYPEGLLTQGKDMDLVNIRGIARACEIIPPTKKGMEDDIEGILELDKGGVELNSGKFVKLYVKVERYWETRNALCYLQASSESNQEIQVKGVYYKEDCQLDIHSLKLGNLEEISLKK
jgi:hypothetical protein